jgi:SAM-dependent methyltransferase
VARARGGEKVTPAIIEHYERALARYGPTARGMDWKDAASQALRFSLLCELCDLSGLEVHEVGAGVGHLYEYLRERGIDVRYSGSDGSSAMVAAARARHPEVEFEQRDAAREARPGRWDVVLCSGLFHVRLDTDERVWRELVHACIRSMYASCRRAIAFNLMRDRVDFRNANLFYSNPDEMRDFCQRELGPDVRIRSDYPLFEYTVYVRRTPGHG